MKITVDFENGMQVTLKPENVQLVDNNGKDTVLTFKTDHTLVPIMFFKSLLATPAELGLRNAALAAAAKAASEKKPAPGAPAATTETGTDKELLKKALDESKPGETVTAGPAATAAPAKQVVTLQRPLQAPRLAGPAVVGPAGSATSDFTPTLPVVDGGVAPSSKPE